MNRSFGFSRNMRFEFTKCSSILKTSWINPLVRRLTFAQTKEHGKIHSRASESYKDFSSNMQKHTQKNGQRTCWAAHSAAMKTNYSIFAAALVVLLLVVLHTAMDVCEARGETSCGKRSFGLPKRRLPARSASQSWKFRAEKYSI